MEHFNPRSPTPDSIPVESIYVSTSALRLTEDEARLLVMEAAPSWLSSDSARVAQTLGNDDVRSFALAINNRFARKNGVHPYLMFGVRPDTVAIAVVGRDDRRMAFAHCDSPDVIEAARVDPAAVAVKLLKAYVERKRQGGAA